MKGVEDLYSWATLLTVFVYPEDVAEDQGALDVWPATHTHYHFLNQEHASWRAAHTAPAIRIATGKGSAVVMNSRLHHRGGENTNKRRRPVFYFSFCEELRDGKKPPPGEYPYGSTYSIRREYAGLIRLKDVLAAERPYRDKAARAVKEAGEEHQQQQQKEAGPRQVIVPNPIIFNIADGSSHVQNDMSDEAVLDSCDRYGLSSQDCNTFLEAARERRRGVQKEQPH